MKLVHNTKKHYYLLISEIYFYQLKVSLLNYIINFLTFLNLAHPKFLGSVS